MKEPSREYSLGELAADLDAALQGDASYKIAGIGTINDAEPHQVTFVSDPAYRKHLAATRAGAVILSKALAGDFDGNVLVVQDPYRSYARLSRLFCRRPRAEAGVHATAVVHPTAVIHPTVAIGPHCVVEAGVEIGEASELLPGTFVGANSKIGTHCLLYPNVTLYHDVKLGNRVTVHSATVIGSDGFGYAPTPDGWEKIYQLGGVVVGDDTEIGSGCTIDRGAIRDTEIGDSVIIDNQVHIAHNVKIGQGTAIAGCCGIAGSAEIGARCLFGGGVLVSGHIKIADGVRFNGASVVTKSITEPGIYSSGTPLQPVKQWQKSAVRVGQLNTLFERVKDLENQLKAKSESHGNSRE